MMRTRRPWLGAALLVVLAGLGAVLDRRSPEWLEADPLLRPFGRVPPADLRAELDSLLAGPAARPASRRAPRPLDPNRATAGEWEALPGVGPKTARAILALRDSIDGFREPEDLLQVRGIGPKRLEALRPWLRFEGTADSLSVGDPPRD